MNREPSMFDDKVFDVLVTGRGLMIPRLDCGHVLDVAFSVHILRLQLGREPTAEDVGRRRGPYGLEKVEKAIEYLKPLPAEDYESALRECGVGRNLDIHLARPKVSLDDICTCGHKRGDHYSKPGWPACGECTNCEEYSNG